MSKEKRRVPKLRFPGFTEDWEQRKADYIFKSVTDKGYPELPVLSASQELGMVYRDQNGIDIQHDKKNEASYKRVLPGQFVIHLRSFQGGFAYSEIEGITSPAYTVINFKNSNEQYGLFWKHVFKSETFIKRLETITYGIRDGRSISFSDFKSLILWYPSFSEQKLIGDSLAVVEKGITLHQRKLEHLNLKKKALLQKLFPKNGERYPELRFPGFTDAWEQRKLSDISTKVTTKNVDVHYTETLTNSAEQGIISQVDFFDKEISNKNNINGYYIVENNDFIYNPRISTLAPVGPINRNKLNRTGIMSPLYTVFRASNVDLGFLEWYFQSNHWHRYMKLNGDSGARADRIAIKDSTFFEMPIKTPVNIKEQVLIGETLEKFNQYITLHQRKLEHLQLQKKALLQQMFV